MVTQFSSSLSTDWPVTARDQSSELLCGYWPLPPLLVFLFRTAIDDLLYICSGHLNRYSIFLVFSLETGHWPVTKPVHIVQGLHMATLYSTSPSS